MSYKIHYFPLRGRAELTRAILALAGQSWEDVTYNQETWPAAKASGKFLFSQLPALELEDGSVLVQSAAIAKYLGRKYDLYSDEPLEAYNIDVVCASASDVLEGYVVVAFRTPEEQKEEALEKFVKGTLTNNLAVWEKLLSKGDTKYIANNKRSIADVEVFLLLEIFEALTPQVLAEFPHLQTFLGDFKNEPGLAEYLVSDKRPAPRPN